MRLGFSLPQFGAQARDSRAVTRFATELEAAGAASFWVGDRLLSPVDPSIGYRGAADLPEEFDAVLDPFVVLTAAAAVTDTALLGSNVLIAPFYPPAQLARQLTGIDRISGGRLLPGFGIGWSPEEYQAAGAPWAHRGAQLDEVLDALGALWGDDPAEHHGARWDIPPHRSLKPVRRPPVYLGGFGGAALRRVGERADGWLPVAALDTWTSGEPIRQARAAIDDAARAAGRDPATIDSVLRVNVPAGTPVERLAEQVREVHADTGIDHLFVDPVYLVSTVEESIRLATRLLSLLG